MTKIMVIELLYGVDQNIIGYIIRTIDHLTNYNRIIVNDWLISHHNQPLGQPAIITAFNQWLWVDLPSIVISYHHNHGLFNTMAYDHYGFLKYL